MIREHSCPKVINDYISYTFIHVFQYLIIDILFFHFSLFGRETFLAIFWLFFFFFCLVSSALILSRPILNVQIWIEIQINFMTSNAINNWFIMKFWWCLTKSRLWIEFDGTQDHKHAVLCPLREKYWTKFCNKNNRS